MDGIKIFDVDDYASTYAEMTPNTVSLIEPKTLLATIKMLNGVDCQRPVDMLVALRVLAHDGIMRSCFSLCPLHVFLHD